MQLVRLGEPGGERPFVRAGDGTTYELGGLTADIDGGFLAADGIARTAAALAAGELPADQGKMILDGLANMAKIIEITELAERVAELEKAQESGQ